MSAPTTNQTFLPHHAEGVDANSAEAKAAEQALAQVVETLNTASADGEESQIKLVLDGNPATAIDLPKPLVQALSQVAYTMHQGLAVSIVPHALTISTQEAADILGVSRPTLIRMLDANKLPYEQANRHRRLKLTDVLAYQETLKVQREKAMDELFDISRELGFYDVPLEEILEVTREVRKGKKSNELS